MRALLARWRALPAAVKASAAFFFASVVASGISYLVTPIYTNILSDAVYGQTQTFLVWVQIFGTLAMFCLSMGVFNNGMVDYPDKRDEYSLSMLVLSNIITVAFTVLLLALYPLLSPYLDIELPLLLLMCLLFFFQPAYNFWTARQRYELRYKATVAFTVLGAFLSPAVAVTCVLLAPEEHHLYARLFGAELALVALYVGFYIYIAVKGRFRVNTKYWRAALLFNLPLIPHYLSTYLLGSSNKLLISHIIDDAATAHYSVAYAVAAVTTIVWGAANATLIPYTYENCKVKNYGAIARITSILLTAFAAVCLLASMFAPEVVAIMTLGKSEYMEAIYVIPPVIGGVFFQVQYYIYANVVYYYKKSRYVMYASVSAVIVNLALGYLAISRWGYLAAGYVTLLSYFLQAVLDYLAMRRALPGERIYNMRYIGILSLAVVAVALASNLLYPYPLLRYGVIVLLAVLGILFRRPLIGAYREMKKK